MVGRESNSVYGETISGNQPNARGSEHHNFHEGVSPYGAILPKRSECLNLFVPVCLSASHMAFGSIRMEPVFFALGQVAGTAAVFAIDACVSVQDVQYEKLVARLLADGQVLSL